MSDNGDDEDGEDSDGLPVGADEATIRENRPTSRPTQSPVLRTKSK